MPPFSQDPDFPQRLRVPLTEPVLSADPSLTSRVLQPEDKFIIFASDGLWDQLTNQEAVEIVHRSARDVCFLVLVVVLYV